MSDFFLFVANLDTPFLRGLASLANSLLWDPGPNVVTPTRLPTLRVAATAEVKRVLVYLFARLRVESDLAYRYPAIVAGVGTQALAGEVETIG
jgi:hypothetical protein